MYGLAVLFIFFYRGIHRCSSLFYSVIYIFYKSYPLVPVLQATAEQIRLAQMIYDKNDADFEDKVNQVRNSYTVLVMSCNAMTCTVM